MDDFWPHLLLGATLEWLRNPATWVAVVLPGMLSIGCLLKWPPRRAETVWALLAVAASCASSRLVASEDTLELHGPSLYAMAVLALTGTRRYLPDTARAYSLCWLVLVLSDALSMLYLGIGRPEVRLPVGIGGGGFRDALFFQPLMLALGLELLKLARAWDQRRRATPEAGLR